MAKAAELSKPFKAGYALPSVQWPEEATDEQRTPGMHHCPFAPGTEERKEWAEGLKAALGEPTKDPAEILKEIDDELGGKS